MTPQHPNEHTEIVIMPGAGGRARPAADRQKIASLVREKLLLTSMEPYSRAQVELQTTLDGSPQTLVVTPLRLHTYTADTVKVTVNPDYTVKSIRRSRASG